MHNKLKQKKKADAAAAEKVALMASVHKAKFTREQALVDLRDKKKQQQGDLPTSLGDKLSVPRCPHANTPSQRTLRENV